MKDWLETYQVLIYFMVMALAALLALIIAIPFDLGMMINPALAVMLFVTFLQVPLQDIGKGFRHFRFLAALCVSNFIVMPVVVFLLLHFITDDLFVRLGVAMVLLAPCIDYVITFAHLGRADARLLLASTPLLLLVQMILLPLYLLLFMGADTARLIRPAPFIEAFLMLILSPLVLAAIVQFWAKKNACAQKAKQILAYGPVPATAFVLFLVVIMLVPILAKAKEQALSALPLYLGYALIAPILGWAIARAFSLRTKAARSIAFSSATRNSLVILPLALAIPDAMPVLPAIIMTQTLVELCAELVYVKVIPLLGKAEDNP